MYRVNAEIAANLAAATERANTLKILMKLQNSGVPLKGETMILHYLGVSSISASLGLGAAAATLIIGTAAPVAAFGALLALAGFHLHLTRHD